MFGFSEESWLGEGTSDVLNFFLALPSRLDSPLVLKLVIESTVRFFDFDSVVSDVVGDSVSSILDVPLLCLCLTRSHKSEESSLSSASCKFARPRPFLRGDVFSPLGVLQLEMLLTVSTCCTASKDCPIFVSLSRVWACCNCSAALSKRVLFCSISSLCIASWEVLLYEGSSNSDTKPSKSKLCSALVLTFSCGSIVSERSSNPLSWVSLSS